MIFLIIQKDISLTCPVVVCVVIWQIVLKELDPASSHIPVYIGVPLIAVSTQVRLLKITI